MIRQVLIRLAIVLSVGWSVFALWMSYALAPSQAMFNVALEEPWAPPADDALIDLPPWERNWSYVAQPPPGFVLDGQVRLGDELERTKTALTNAEAAGDTRAVGMLASYVLQLENTAILLHRRDIAAATRQRDEARVTIRDHIILTVVGWGIPIIAVWSIVWIMAPLSRERKPEG